jgi:EmrB/QacA subfamily drug resistance transporter
MQAQPSTKLSPAPAEPYPLRWAALVVLMLATFMNLLDLTIVNVAIPTLQTGLHSTPSQIEWIVAGYALAFALGLLPFGRLGDIVERKHLFLIGAAIFTLASAACGLAPTIEWLIAARVLEGIGGGIMAPQVLAIIQLMFGTRERGLAFSLYGLTSGLAAVAGPIIGGTLLNADLFGLDWRPIFLVNGPIGLLVVLVGLFVVPVLPRDRTGSFDLVGTVISALAMLALVYPLVQGQALGWPSWLFALIGASHYLFAAFLVWEVRRERRGQTPLISTQLITSLPFVLGAAMTLLLFSAVPGLFLVMAVFLQDGFGFTPFESGLSTVPWPIGVAVASGISAAFDGRFAKQRLLAGVAALIIGGVLLRFTLSHTGMYVDPSTLAPALLVAGIGVGLLISPLLQLTLAGVPASQAGAASGALQALQQAGAVLGVAIVGQIFFGAVGRDHIASHAVYVGAIEDALIYVIGVFVLLAFAAPFVRPIASPEAAPEQNSVSEPRLESAGPVRR